MNFIINLEMAGERIATLTSGDKKFEEEKRM